MRDNVIDLHIAGKLRKSRAFSRGGFTVYVTHRTAKNEKHIAWKPREKVKASVYYSNPKSLGLASDNVHIFSCSATSLDSLKRKAFNQFWRTRYSYATMHNDKAYQEAYLKHCIKNHTWWCDRHSNLALEAETTKELLKHQEYADFNSDRIEYLTKLLQAL